MEDKILKCPFCKSKLILGDKKRYETVVEHVDNPNINQYPLRNTYLCNCEDSKGVFWDIYGDIHSLEFKNNFINKNTSAINSDSWKFNERYY